VRGKLGWRLLPLIVALAMSAIAAPSALADTETTGPINVQISSSPTSGMSETNGTWAPDGTEDPAILNVTDLGNSLAGQMANVVVSSTSTATAGTASTDAGNIDIEADPGDNSGDVEFSPASGGTTLIDTTTITLDQQQYDGPVQLDNNTTFDSTTSTTFGSTVDGPYALTADGAVSFAGTVGGTVALASLTANDSTDVDTDAYVTTSGNQDYVGAVTVDVGPQDYVGEDLVSTSAGDITFGSALDSNGNALSLRTETAGKTRFDGAVTDFGTLDVGGPAGSASEGQTVIDTSEISAQNGGTTEFDNPVRLGADLTISEDTNTPDGGYVDFYSTLDSGPNSSDSLTDTTPDSVGLGTVGDTTPLSSVDLSKATLSGDVNTTGAQTYGTASSSGTPTLNSSGGAITFTGTVGGSSPGSLTTDTTGTTSIDSGVQGPASAAGLTSLTIDGPATLAGTIHTGGDQTYSGAVTLGSNPELISDSGDVDASQSLDLGNNDLTVEGSGQLGGVISGDGSLELGSQQSSSGAPQDTIELVSDNTFKGGVTIDGTGSLLEFTNPDNFGTGALSIADGAGIEWAPGNTADISNVLAPIGPDGTVFDTNGNNVTFNTPLTDAAAGQPGTIVKDGAGELTLTADNTLDMPWEVTGGTLGVTGSLAGKVTVDPSSALSCDGGTLSGGFVNDGGTASYAPDAPTKVTASAGTSEAVVSFTPGASRCSPFTGYEVTAEPGNTRAPGTSSPITVSGLRGGTTYTFTVTATNVIGSSAASAPSAPVTTSRLVYALIGSPSSGHTYTVGQKVKTIFSCAALVSGGLALCRDSNGATGGAGRLDTSRPGRYTYVVTASGNDGSTDTTSIAYAVVLPSNQFTISGVKAQAGGVVTFAVKVPDAGRLSASEAAGRTKLATTKLTSKGPTTLHVRLKLTAQEREKLGKPGLEATLTVTFTPTGGRARTVKHSGVRLKG
jgi:autotransporter-associated beta strand protein